MMILQVQETVQALTKYDDSDIVKGMIICAVLMTLCGMAFVWVYDRYLKTNKLNLADLPAPKVDLTALDALKITATMAEQILKIPVDGHSVEKRIAKLHHDTTQALQQSDNATSVLTQLHEGQEKFIEIVRTAYQKMENRDEKHHKERMELQEKYLELLTKQRTNGRK